MVGVFDSHHLFVFLKEMARACAWLFVLTMIFLPLERVFALHRKPFFGKALAQDLGYYFVNSLVPGLLLAAPLSVVAAAEHFLMPAHFQNAVAAWPLWQRVVVGFLVGEIGFYWGHRWSHQIPFLWRFHSIHHSAESIYFLISARAHPIDNVFIKLCGLIPAVLLGVASPLSPTGSLVPTLIVLTTVIWGFMIHANVRWRLGLLEWIVATPAFHHWHHTLSDHKDRNFASMMPVMDWVFGTFHLPRQWPSAYGIEGTVPPTLVGQMLFPFRAPVPQAVLPRQVATDSR